MDELKVGNSKIKLVKGDITLQLTDAIVNAANSSLAGGGGVDGAIHSAAGPQLHEECMEWVAKHGPCRAGNVVMTSGGRLKPKVIHTVGPVWRGGSSGEPGVLASCYEQSLALALEKGLDSIAFPSISTGAYGYPVVDAARVALKTVKKFLEDNPGSARVVFVLFDEKTFQSYSKALKQLGLD
jgi:O-acetyl-ADP-ribose deacetylase (regulator of RNase III)